MWYERAVRAAYTIVNVFEIAIYNGNVKFVYRHIVRNLIVAFWSNTVDIIGLNKTACF